MGKDPDGVVDSSDPWYFFCYDEAWRVAATFRAGDTSPKERFIPHLAGLAGYGGSSYIDSVLMRDSDSAAWTAAGSSTLSIRRYYCQNWRGDVSLIVKASGAPVEWVKYSAYGEPFCIKAGDANSDGNVTITGTGNDSSTISGWISATTYDVRGDLDGDGDVDSADLALLSAETLGRGIQSSSGMANRIGYAGYQWEPNTTKYLARHRWYDQRLGRWMSRDSIDYPDGPSLYEYSAGDPVDNSDPTGMATGCGTCNADSGAVAGPPVLEPPVIPSPSPATPGPLWEPDPVQFDPHALDGLPLDTWPLVCKVSICVYVAGVSYCIGEEISPIVYPPIGPAPEPNLKPIKPRQDPNNPCKDQERDKDRACGRMPTNGQPPVNSPPRGFPKGLYPGTPAYCRAMKDRIENSRKCLRAREDLAKCYASHYGPDKSGYNHPGQTERDRKLLEALIKAYRDTGCKKLEDPLTGEIPD